MGNPPKRVFIEMAREKTDQGRTSSRKKKLLELYKKCKAEEKDWIDEIEKRSDAEAVFVLYAKRKMHVFR